MKIVLHKKRTRATKKRKKILRGNATIPGYNPLRGGSLIKKVSYMRKENRIFFFSFLMYHTFLINK